MIENVYTVAPSISPSSRVQITSAASAVAPESAIVTYTGHAPGAITTFESLAGGYSGDCLASAKLTSPTVTLIAAASERRCRHVEDAQQVEARQQTAQHRADRVRPVQQSHPGDAFREALIQREAAGSDAPIRKVGGSRHSAHTSARSRIAGSPWPTAEVYTESTSGIRNSTRMPQAAMPNSILPYTRSGCCPAAFKRGSSRLPRHRPPMNVASRTPSETALEPITSCSS